MPHPNTYCALPKYVNECTSHPLKTPLVRSVVFSPRHIFQIFATAVTLWWWLFQETNMVDDLTDTRPIQRKIHNHTLLFIIVVEISIICSIHSIIILFVFILLSQFFKKRWLWSIFHIVETVIKAIILRLASYIIFGFIFFILYSQKYWFKSFNNTTNFEPGSFLGAYGLATGSYFLAVL